VSKTQPMADSRDMFVVHDMFRRQFKGIPGLVSEVPGGDAAQVAIIADHVTWMVTFLHAHHEGADQFVWPKLLERIPVNIDPLILTMEAQHAGLATALDDLKAKAARWRTTCAIQERDAVSVAVTELLVRIAEHLDQEEREVLPLIDMYLTEKEWQQVGGSGLNKMSFGQLKVAFGMILDDAGPEQVKVMRDTIPPRPMDAVFPHRTAGLRQVRQAPPQRRRSRPPSGSLRDHDEPPMTTSSPNSGRTPAR